VFTWSRSSSPTTRGFSARPAHKVSARSARSLECRAALSRVHAALKACSLRTGAGRGSSPLLGRSHRRPACPRQPTLAVQRCLMLKRTPPSARKPASATHDNIMEMALELIKPNPAQTEKVHDEVGAAILTIMEVERQPATSKRELHEIASALRGAVAALKRWEEQWEHSALTDGLVRTNDQLCELTDDQILVLQLTDDQLDQLLATDNQLPSLRKKLAAIAELAEAKRRRLEASMRKGRPKAIQKTTAAFFAHRLLRTYGGKPTLSTNGAFFQLAAVLYAGATGIADADLSQACRRIFHDDRPRVIFRPC
jgi:hypothetical protein